jgi:uncharacterized protein (DUF697 family)
MEDGRLKKVLDWSYDRAIANVESLEGSHKDTSSMIRWESAKAGSVGFVTGLGGLATMPVTIPADMAAMLKIQLRLVVTIAHKEGHDLSSEKVRMAVYLCLFGNSGREILHEAGVQFGRAMTMRAIKGLSADTLKAINKAVGFRLLTKFGQTGTVQLGKAVPIVGGLLGGTVDLLSTQAVGRVANRVFTD